MKVSIHNVVDIKQKRTTLESPNGEEFHTIDFIIIDDNGVETVVTIFTDRVISLSPL